MNQVFVEFYLNWIILFAEPLATDAPDLDGVVSPGDRYPHHVPPRAQKDCRLSTTVRKANHHPHGPTPIVK
jgi:hypothetical protein